jgi:hypothetical protein
MHRCVYTKMRDLSEVLCLCGRWTRRNRHGLGGQGNCRNPIRQDSVDRLMCVPLRLVRFRRSTDGVRKGLRNLQNHGNRSPILAKQIIFKLRGQPITMTCDCDLKRVLHMQPRSVVIGQINLANTCITINALRADAYPSARVAK